MTASLAFQIVLWIWFLGCVITWRAGQRLLVEGMGIRSAEFVMLCVYTAGMAAGLFLRPAGKWVLLGILAMWFIVQFFCHWYYTFFGAGTEKISGYNKCFRDTVRLFPMKEDRVIPDLYHIVLHVLILLNIFLLFLT